MRPAHPFTNLLTRTGAAWVLPVYFKSICFQLHYAYSYASRLVSNILTLRWRASPGAKEDKGGNMSILAWIVLGLLAGFIGSKLVNRRGEGLIMDILLGIVGAVVGGWLFRTFGSVGVTGLNLYSLLVAVVGAVVVLLVYHAVRRV